MQRAHRRGVVACLILSAPAAAAAQVVSTERMPDVSAAGSYGRDQAETGPIINLSPVQPRPAPGSIGVDDCVARSLDAAAAAGAAGAVTGAPAINKGFRIPAALATMTTLQCTLNNASAGRMQRWNDIVATQVNGYRGMLKLFNQDRLVRGAGEGLRSGDLGGTTPALVAAHLTGSWFSRVLSPRITRPAEQASGTMLDNTDVVTLFARGPGAEGANRTGALVGASATSAQTAVAMETQASELEQFADSIAAELAGGISSGRAVLLSADMAFAKALAAARRLQAQVEGVRVEGDVAGGEVARTGMRVSAVVNPAGYR